MMLLDSRTACKLGAHCSPFEPLPFSAASTVGGDALTCVRWQVELSQTPFAKAAGRVESAHCRSISAETNSVYTATLEYFSKQYCRTNGKK